MKRLLQLTFFLLLGLPVTAQQYQLTGRVVDPDGAGVAYANLVLRTTSDSTFARAAAANGEGDYTLTGVDAGEYWLATSGLGYAPRQQRISVTGDRALEPILLAATAETLEDVVVVAEKPIVQVMADKTVFNVDKTIGAAGSSGWELLRKAPGVVIDNADNLILEGKSGAEIYVNGKPSPLRGSELRAFLESVQASDIESVELITQPSSKYDAAGNAGIVNIVLRKDKSLGTNGSVSAGVTVGERDRYNSSVSFNNRSRRGNLYGSYGNRFGESTGFLYLFRQQNGTQFDARTNSVFGRESHNARLGYDLFATARSTFGILVTGNRYAGDTRNDSRTPIRPVGAEENDRVLVANNRSDNSSTNFTGNLNYVYEDTAGHRLAIDFDYGRYRNDGYTFQPNFFFAADEETVLSERITAQETPTDINLTSGKADYSFGLGKGTFGLGAKVSFVETDNAFTFFEQLGGALTRVADQSNQFAYSEQINAAYVNYNLPGKVWSFQAGLRVENTVSDGNLTSEQDLVNQRVKRNYTDFFPSGGMTFQLNRRNRFALNYSRRVTRPNYSSLNPFEYRIDELSARRGNPFLQPQYANSLKLTHTYNYRLNTSLSFTRVTDFFAQITEISGENSNFINVRNIANQSVLNLGVSYPTKLTEWWSSYVSINAYTSSYDATDPDFQEVSQQTLSGYAQQTFTLPQGVTLEVSGWYNSPSIWGGTYQTRSIGSLNAAVQRNFVNDKLAVRLAVNDIFFTSPWEGTTRFGALFIEGTGGRDSRNVSLNLTYNFGSSEVRRARNRDTATEDERRRIN